MKFIKVSHSLNKSYNVEDLAIKQAVTKAFNAIKNIKVKDLDIIIDESAKGFKIHALVEKKPEAKYSEIIKKIEDSVNGYSINLIGTKPNNIEIKFN